MKKLLLLLIVIFLCVLGMLRVRSGSWFSFENPFASKKEPERSYSQRVHDVAQDLFVPLSEKPVRRTRTLKDLFKEGRRRYENGQMSESDARRTAAAIQLLQELQLARDEYQAEYERIRKMDFQSIGQGGSIRPEEKQQHFIDNQKRLWKLRLDEASLPIQQALPAVR